jgi:hypothetical protein
MSAQVFCDFTSNKFVSAMGYIMQKIDWLNYSKVFNKAYSNPRQKHTAVLFEYVHSGIDDEIAMMQRIPGTTTTVEDVLHNAEIIKALNKTLVCDKNIQWYTRRKRDFLKEGLEQLTNKRELIVVFQPYALAPKLFGNEKSSISPWPYAPDDDFAGSVFTDDDMPSLIPMNNSSE